MTSCRCSRAGHRMVPDFEGRMPELRPGKLSRSQMRKSLGTWKGILDKGKAQEDKQVQGMGMGGQHLFHHVHQDAPWVRGPQYSHGLPSYQLGPSQAPRTNRHSIHSRTLNWEEADVEAEVVRWGPKQVSLHEDKKIIKKQKTFLEEIKKHTKYSNLMGSNNQYSTSSFHLFSLLYCARFQTAQAWYNCAHQDLITHLQQAHASAGCHCLAWHSN